MTQPAVLQVLIAIGACGVLTFAYVVARDELAKSAQRRRDAAAEAAALRRAFWDSLQPPRREPDWYLPRHSATLGPRDEEGRSGRIEIDNDGVRARAADGSLLWGIPVVSSEHVRPTPRQIAGVDAVRIVRHGLSDAGLLPASEGPVGPKPGEPFDIAYVVGGKRPAMLVMSPERLDAMSRRYEREAQMHTSGQGKTHPGHKDDCISIHCGLPESFVKVEDGEIKPI